MRKLHILDTSVLIEDPGAYKSYKNSDVIIPISVINELDKKKHHVGEAGKNARVCIRLLDQISELGDIHTGILLDNDVLLKVDASYRNVPFGFGDPTYADTEILVCAYYYYTNHPADYDTTLVSNDLNLRLKAKARGIDACGHASKFSLSDLYAGSRTITNETAAIELQQKGVINPVDFDIDMSMHECVLFEDDDGNGLAMGRKVSDKKIKLIKKTYPWNVKSRNKEQTFAIDLIFDKGIDLVTLIGKAGSGKAQPLDADIYTPDGIIKMGDIQIGNIVCTPDGDTAKVIGVFPQGEKDIYKVVFSDGTSAECCEEHLWYTKTSLERDQHKNGNVRSLKEIKDNIYYGINKKKNHSIPMTQPVEFSTKKLVLDPYAFGCLIGDGTFRFQLGFCTSDKFIASELNQSLNKCGLKLVKKDKYSYVIKGINKIKLSYEIHKLDKNGNMIETFQSISDIPSTCSKHSVYKAINNEKMYNGYYWKYGSKKSNSQLHNYLIDNNLWMKKSEDKFIPNDYKYTSVQNRIFLLQGLMDTYGSVEKNGKLFEFTTTSKRLSEDVKWIVQSLGGTASINKRKTKFTHNGIKKEGKLSYRMLLKLPNNINPFKLPRKAETVKNRVKYHPVRYIVDIEYIGKKKAQCILINNKDHLYITNDFIVTHNTLVATASALELVIDRKEYEKLIIYRPIQPVSNDIGYLPGDMAEKLAPWFQAIMDNFEYLFQTKNGDWRKELEMFQRKGRIEMEALTYIRGRSIPNSIIMVDECFPYDQNIETNLGKKRIGILYDMWKSGKKLPLVKTYNEKNGRFEYKQITHAWNRGEKSLIKLTCGNREIKCTNNHKFLTKNGWIKCEDLNIGDFIKTTEPKSHQILRDLNEDQLQIILGSFLGDGSISNHGLNRYRLKEVHGINQKEYCEWKGNILHAKQKIIKNNGYSQKPAIQIQTKMFGLSDYLPNNKSYCPNWLIDKLDAKGLAIWFMDDGSVNSNYNGAQLSTCSFDLQTQIKLVEKLNSMGIECKISFVNMKGKRAPGYYYISFRKRGYEQLCSVISPYVHQSMIYKVNNAACNYNWNDKYHTCGLTVVDNIEFDIGNETVYDIEVEDNHNFIVCSTSRKTLGGVIAHNCQNISKEDIKTVLTRVGEGTKIILTGDIEQIDNSGLDATSNGLSYVIEKFKESNLAGHITFTQGERSRLATLAAEIL